MKFARGVSALALVGMLAVLVVGPSQATNAQVVRSDSGMVANASVHRPDGNGLVSFLFVVPSGGVTASDPGSLFARPWVAVDVYDGDGNHVCNTVTAPRAFNGGHRHANPDRLDGVAVEAVCGGTVYSAHWRYRGAWLRAHPIHATSGQKVFDVTGDGHTATTTVWPTEQQTLTVEVCEQAGGRRACAAGKRIGDIVLSNTGVLTVGS